MTGKLFGILLMVLLVILAWKWLRPTSARPPAPRPPHGSDGQPGADADREPAKTIELQQDADGVYRPRGERPKNDQDNRTKP